MEPPRQRPLFLAAAAVLVADGVLSTGLLLDPRLLGPALPTEVLRRLLPLTGPVHLLVGLVLALGYLRPAAARSWLTREAEMGRLVASGPSVTYRARVAPWAMAGLGLVAASGMYWGFVAATVGSRAPGVAGWGLARLAAYAAVAVAARRGFRLARSAGSAA